MKPCPEIQFRFYKMYKGNAHQLQREIAKVNDVVQKNTAQDKSWE